MPRIVLGCLVLLAGATPAWAASADSMFDGLSRDFGAVPHGNMASHPFRLVNRTGKTVHISNVRVSCGCTSVRLFQDTLAPGEETAILVQMDTRRFYGVRSVSVYVQFDQPQFEEVRLWVQADSRDDVAVVPESFGFGRVKPGTAAVSKVSLSFFGDANCQITGARCDSNYVQVRYEETRREGGQIEYQISAQLRPGIPLGTWFTDVWLTTSSPTLARLRVPLAVEIAPNTKVRVQQIAVGTIKLGDKVDRQVILRGASPFRVTSISGGDAEIRAQDSNAESRPIHVLTVTIRPTTAGSLQKTIRVRTDLGHAGEIELQTSADVVP